MPDEKRSEPRVGAELKIRLAYDSMDDFVERYAKNVSRGGIFVRTRDPRPAGTELQPTAPWGARPIEPAPGKRSFFGKLFGARRP